MGPAVVAGLLYVAVVFAAGFVLGTVRVLLLAPAIGESGAVLVELPVMLALSWIVARDVVLRFEVPRRGLDRFVMGAIAFTVLMMAEAAVGMLLFGRSFAEHAAGYGEPARALGLLAQMVFAAIPTILLFLGT